MVRSFLFKTSDLANGACAVTYFEAFLDENEVLPANGGPCNGRVISYCCKYCWFNKRAVQHSRNVSNELTLEI